MDERRLPAARSDEIRQRVDAARSSSNTTSVDDAALALLDVQLHAMSEIRRLHPEVPETVNFSAPLRPGVHAHYWHGRWEFDGESFGEICVNADHLHYGADHVLVCLLHEAVHAAHDALGIRGTSRQGRWHNQRFAESASEFGLIVERTRQVGFTTTGLLPIAYERYGRLLTDLRQTLVLFRSPSSSVIGSGITGSGRPITVSSGPANGGYVSATCGCTTASGKPRRLRMSIGSWEVGPILCTVCDHNFSASEEQS